MTETITAQSVLIQVAPELAREEDVDGWRWYHLKDAPQSGWFISVTESMKCAVDERLMNYVKNTSAQKQDDTLEDTANIGSDLHNIMEAQALGNQVEVPEKYTRAITNWGFIKTKHNIRAEATEVAVYSKKHGYAGTIDIVGEVDGQPAIIDFKTGFLSVKAGWQLAAYREAYREMTGREYGMVVIQVKRDGSEAKLFKYEHIDWCLDCFLAALKVFKGLYFHKLNKLGWRWLKE